MTWQMLLVFGLLAATFALMVWEKLPLDLVAMLAFSALLVTGILAGCIFFTRSPESRASASRR